MFIWKHNKWIVKIHFLLYKFKLGNIAINVASNVCRKDYVWKRIVKNNTNDSKKKLLKNNHSGCLFCNEDDELRENIYIIYNPWKNV